MTSSLLHPLLDAHRSNRSASSPLAHRLLRVWPKAPFASDGTLNVALYSEPLPHEAIDSDRYMKILNRLHPRLDRQGAEMMLKRHIIFGASDESHDPPSLIALVQARVVAPGELLSADSLHFDTNYVDDVIPVARANQYSIICDNAATIAEKQYEGHGITQRLITSVVVPYLAQHETFRDYAWLTSSPVPDMARCAQLLARSPGVGELADLLDGEMHLHRPFGFASLREVLSASEAFFREFGLIDPVTNDVISLSHCDHVTGLRRVLLSMLTDRELTELVSTNADRAARYLKLIDRLATPCDGGDFGRSHRAAKVLSFLLAVLMQCDLYDGSTSASRGKAVDLTTNFHNDAGGIRGGGPLPFARLQHRSSWGHGQRFLYTPAYRENARQYAETVKSRRARLPRHDIPVLYFDRDHAQSFIRTSLRDVSAAHAAL